MTSAFFSRSTLVRAACIAALTVGVAQVQAQATGESGGPTFGGLGSVSFGVTDRYTHLTGKPDGNFRNSQFGLRTVVPFGDRLAVSGLINWREEGMDRGTPRADVTYLFATVRLSRAWDLRIGKVKYPNNLYSEVYDIGTLRPFLSLPQGIYGGTGNAFTSYTGVGVNGTAYAGDWQLGIAGHVSGGAFQYSSSRIALIPGSTNDRLDLEIRRQVGGRVFVRPPIPGLLIGVSGASHYFTTCPGGGQFIPCPFGASGSQGSAQLEYLGQRLWIRSEVATLGAPGFISTNAGYAQAAFFVTKKWQVAAQYDYLRERFKVTLPELVGQTPGATPPMQQQGPNPLQLLALLPDDLDKHRDVAFGLNYWFAPDLVAKLSVHRTDGWRFADPGASTIIQGLMTRRLPSATSNLLQAGIQFNF
jgi:hypothetical protein